ncbi:hypothetical protein A4R35_02880 [Thermogemmatispora tikiterensis]|uniref:Uncharacterized protein n=1 Tax=Thermogemmatispora tikiterensis TaxID=1825093 RepID=A0A328VEK2_9CHLR|nr:hypothetical protein A4R35_02880 [Thermogemmatispora tikiterensis]
MTLVSGFREKERATRFTHTHELSSFPGDRFLPLEKRGCSEQAAQPGQQEGIFSISIYRSWRSRLRL